MEEVTITIIGAGVIGLAIASEISKKYESIVVLERHSSFGQEISRCRGYWPGNSL
ncbi:MAG: FAD-dependent oxidoreductase [Thermodesulfobacteriota bacterium]